MAKSDGGTQLTSVRRIEACRVFLEVFEDEYFASDVWDYDPTIGHSVGINLFGFTVEATDGSIGKIEKHSDEAGAAYFVVDTVV
ncbi:hypothetical protein [Streptomyces sp. NBC_01455]|uniref:hypothetical protein n=1 Tax=Streptomyces sp. NBC_01455 TaxID=2903874 RepID=UPI002E2EEDCC|nr:hypothetical protein [Streptomyces sp. NBC_01455]